MATTNYNQQANGNFYFYVAVVLTGILVSCSIADGNDENRAGLMTPMSLRQIDALVIQQREETPGTTRSSPSQADFEGADTVYRKDGSVIRGTVVLMTEESVLIRASGNNQITVVDREYVRSVVYALGKTITYGKRKNPWTAGILSFIVPGSGELYCHKWLQGGMFFGAAFATGTQYQKTGDPLWLALGLGIKIASTIDAVTLAKKSREPIEVSLEPTFTRKQDGFQVALTKRF